MIEQSAGFTIAAVEGVTLTKWTRTWEERVPGVTLTVLRTTSVDQLVPLGLGADVAFVRDIPAGEGLSAIPLYREAPVVVVPKDHPISVFDAVEIADLEGENRLDGAGSLTVWADAIALVAANVGIVVAPQSIARLHSRSDVVARPVTDAPETAVFLAWHTDRTTDLVEAFIGIVRGRTAQSSRAPSGGAETASDGPPAKPSRPASGGATRGTAERRARPNAEQARAAARRRRAGGR